jgi:hypothetical protein
LHEKSYLGWYEREKRLVFCFLWTILNLILLVSPSSFTHYQLCKTPSHFFLCIFWSFTVLKKCCSLTSQRCHNNNNFTQFDRYFSASQNNIHQVKGTHQHVPLHYPYHCNIVLLQCHSTMSLSQQCLM